MKFPALLHGPGPRVRRDAKKVITRLKRGCTIVEAFDELGGFIEVRPMPGWILLEYTHTPYESFHLYAVLHRLRERYWETLLNPFDDALFEALISTDWGVAMLLCEPGGEFFGPHERTLASGRYHRFLDMVVQHWPVFTGLNERWSRSGFNGSWNPLDISYTLINVLHACNIDNDTIVANAHLGLPELLRRYPPEPEKYVPPDGRLPPMPITDETEREAFRAELIERYRGFVDMFPGDVEMLGGLRRGADEVVIARGFDPADLDPYWNDRPENKH